MVRLSIGDASSGRGAPRSVLLAAWIAIAMLLLVSCAGSSSSSPEPGTGGDALPTRPPTTRGAATTQPSTTRDGGSPRSEDSLVPAAPGSPPTVAPSTGDGSLPTIESFEITPSEDADCRDGRVVAMVSWRVTPATATVTIRSLEGSRAREEIGPFANVGSVLLPAWFPCDGRAYAVSLEAVNGGPRFAAVAGHVSAEAR